MEDGDGMEDTDGERFSEAMAALNRISQSISLMDKNNRDCLACDNTIEISTIGDVVRMYSYLLACVSDHVAKVLPIDFRDAFIVESLILDNICEKKVLDFNKIFEEIREPCDFVKKEIREAAEKCLLNNSINIDCEQELDSLMYKVYKKCVDSNFSKNLSLKEVELLLVILFRRSESSRFFKVFGRHKKSKGIFRLGLLMSLKDGDEASMHKLLEGYNEDSLSVESYFLSNESDFLRRSIDPDWILLGEDNKEWISFRRKEMEWEECVHFWAVNREGSSSALNKSMMDLCIKHEKYEEGWVVYSRGCKKTLYVIHKACLLSLKGLRQTNDRKWISRLFEVVEASGPEEDDAKYLVASDVIENLSALSENTRNLVLKEFITRMDLLGKNEKIVNLVIRGLLSLCQKCEESQKAHTSLGNYADILYTKWKKHKLCGNYPLDNRDQIESEIYSNVLSVFDTLQDKEKVLGVCKDVVNSNAKITKELCSKIQALHTVNLESLKSEPTSLEQYSVLERLVSLVLQKH
ncbi:uncharacterized protein Eint_061570 [Encephalitozoon intestinalis ATCC 50506]|uniref:Uncharacterized protein n=1 Tax=Encephalitozoon intestinalis (strain ATCC 50506) TaxID=876142 RepID=E0S7C6_ENCIT|nr:uncharacterized protein Eint_061570 [Encephalitozoon intestinalis ATCC 50506]ADM11761.1 hypothetical protein Eint_061570 [Encephalitozoon intestinalis ATCC 50506]UTX45502.1 hypothetical protein GPK93_06g10600 [Encephalitozoon intestinalis]